MPSRIPQEGQGRPDGGARGPHRRPGSSTGTTAISSAVKSQDAGLNLFQIKPTVSSYMNGPNVFQYSIGVLGTYDRELAERLFLNSGVNLDRSTRTSAQAVGVEQQHLARTSAPISASTTADRPLKLDHLLLNRVYQPVRAHLCARLSGGYIETDVRRHRGAVALRRARHALGVRPRPSMR